MRLNLHKLALIAGLIEGQILLERGAYRAGEAVLLKARDLAADTTYMQKVCR